MDNPNEFVEKLTEAWKEVSTLKKKLKELQDKHKREMEYLKTELMDRNLEYEKLHRQNYQMSYELKEYKSIIETLRNTSALREAYFNAAKDLEHHKRLLKELINADDTANV